MGLGTKESKQEWLHSLSLSVTPRGNLSFGLCSSGLCRVRGLPLEKRQLCPGDTTKVPRLLPGHFGFLVPRNQ